MFRLLFFFNDTATTEIYTLSLHDALPISGGFPVRRVGGQLARLPDLLAVQVGDVHVRHDEIGEDEVAALLRLDRDRKSTRLNSSHANISYAVFCLKKKNT